MEPVQVNQVLCCDKCGVELQVITKCDSSCTCNITCCGQVMHVRDADSGQDSAATDCCG